MLASAETIEIVADALVRYKLPVSVVDPVRCYIICSCTFYLMPAGHGINEWSTAAPKRSFALSSREAPALGDGPDAQYPGSYFIATRRWGRCETPRMSRRHY